MEPCVLLQEANFNVGKAQRGEYKTNTIPHFPPSLPLPPSSSLFLPLPPPELVDSLALNKYALFVYLNPILTFPLLFQRNFHLTHTQPPHSPASPSVYLHIHTHTHTYYTPCPFNCTSPSLTHRHHTHTHTHTQASYFWMRWTKSAVSPASTISETWEGRGYNRDCSRSSREPLSILLIKAPVRLRPIMLLPWIPQTSSLLLRGRSTDWKRS